MTRVRLARGIRRAMIAHARRQYPNECCGFLIGNRQHVLHVLPLPNVDPRPRIRFRISDEQHIEVRRLLRRFEPPLAIIGVYHSHPDGPAVPSSSDIREANYSDWVFAVIGVSRRGARVKLFGIRSGRVRLLRPGRPK